MDVARETFLQQRKPRFGTANPERMRLELWEWLVRGRADPYHVRVELGVEHDFGGRPDWCFDRFGATRTELGDGRLVFVAGEHEDSYDPDFCIYNDVVVLSPTAADRERLAAADREGERGWEGTLEGEIEIYGYPAEVFPPTDFHTATRIGDRLLLIGRLGYGGTRVSGVTPVFWLHTTDWRIEPVVTSGDNPGWIFRHEAALDDGAASVIVRGGQQSVQRGGAEAFVHNVEEYRLGLADMQWERISNRGDWRQFAIRLLDRRDWIDLPYPGRDEVFRPKSVPHEPVAVPGEERWSTFVIRVEGVVIRFRKQVDEVTVVVEGALTRGITERVLADVMASMRSKLGKELVLVEL